MREGSINIPNCNIVGIDTSEDMLHRARELSKNLDRIEFICDDIRNAYLSDASVVVLNLTLQFLPREDRDQLIKKVHDSMLPGGVLIVSEKTLSTGDANQALLTKLYHGFKSDQGYSKLEISQKRDALEAVLIPETVDDHLTRLRAAGFAQVLPWYQAFSFVSVLAIKK